MFKKYYLACLLSILCNCAEVNNLATFNWKDLPHDIKTKILQYVYQDQDYQNIIPEIYWHSKASITINPPDPNHLYQINVFHKDLLGTVTGFFSDFEYKQCGISTNSKLIWYTKVKLEKISFIETVAMGSTFHIEKPFAYLDAIDGTEKQFILCLGTRLELYQESDYSQPIAIQNLPTDIHVQAIRFNKDQSKIAVKSKDNRVFVYVIKKDDNHTTIEPYQYSLKYYILLKENLLRLKNNT